MAEFQLLGDKLALGQTLPIQHEGHHRAKAHIRGIHRLVATGNGDYTSHIALAAVALGLGIANPNG